MFPSVLKGEMFIWNGSPQSSDFEMKCLSEIFPIWKHLYFKKKKKVTLPTKFNSVLPGGLVPKLFFCGKIAINQEIILLLSGVQPHLPCWKELGPEKHFGGEKPDLFIHIFYKEQYCCPPGGGNRAAKTKPGFIWCCNSSGSLHRSLHSCGGYGTCSFSSPKHLKQNPGTKPRPLCP